LIALFLLLLCGQTGAISNPHTHCTVPVSLVGFRSPNETWTPRRIPLFTYLAGYVYKVSAVSCEALNSIFIP